MARQRHSRFGPTPRHQRFMSLPRHKRRDMAVALRWRIHQDADGAGVFTSHQYIPGSPSCMDDDKTAISHWADFLFLSEKPIRQGLYYNAYAHTVSDAVVSILEDQAREAVAEMLSLEETERQHDANKMTFKPAGKGLFEMVFGKAPVHASLGDQTVSKAQAEWLKDALLNWDKMPQMSETYELDHAYRNGIGLHIVTDHLSIDVGSLQQIIFDFWSRGEKSWKGPVCDLTPHRPAIEARVWHHIVCLERSDARDRGVEPEAFDPTAVLSPEALRNFHNNSAGIKM